MFLFGSTNESSKKNCSERFLIDVVSSMLDNKVSFLVKKDSLIMAYGSFIYSSRGKSKKQYVFQKMRMLGRLLEELFEATDDDATGLSDFLKPEYFEEIVSATKKLCGLTKDDTPNELPYFKTTSLALKIGYALKQRAVLHRGYALRERDVVALDSLKYFVELIESEWSTQISSIALKTVDDGKFKAPGALPVTSDLLILRNYLLLEMGHSIKSLKKSHQ